MTWIWLDQTLAEESWPLGEDKNKIRGAHKIAQLIKELAAEPSTMSSNQLGPSYGWKKRTESTQVSFDLTHGPQTKIKLFYFLLNEKKNKIRVTEPRSENHINWSILSLSDFSTFQNLSELFARFMGYP